MVISRNQTLGKQYQFKFSNKFVCFMKRDIWATIMHGKYCEIFQKLCRLS
jgi:hypothetical protein